MSNIKQKRGAVKIDSFCVQRNEIFAETRVVNKNSGFPCPGSSDR